MDSKIVCACCKDTYEMDPQVVEATRVHEGNGSGTPNQGTPRIQEYDRNIPTWVLVFLYHIPTLILGFPVWGSHLSHPEVSQPEVGGRSRGGPRTS